jgi:phosphinothricin acetyltransferase
VQVNYVINEMVPGDWEQVRAIYLEGIATGYTTFETNAPSWEKWDASHLRIARLVARRGDEVLGWAALSPVSNRHVYRGVAELTISVRNEIWTLQAAIFPENTASVKLHLRCGFREVGRRERIGKLNGNWRDTLLFERRSKIVGVD